jgi:preprotein translocase subunit SecA
MDRMGVGDDDTPIQNKTISKTLEAAQKRVEGYNFDARKNVVQYDNVINRHRRVVYTMRRRILEGGNIKPEIVKLQESKLRELTQVPAKNNKKFAKEFKAVFPIDDDKIKQIGDIKKDKERFEKAKEAVETFYAGKEIELGEDNMRTAEREVYLQVLDTLWMQHLENMQHLREGIHWRSMGQRDPLVEYRAESQKLFDSLQATLRDEVLRAVNHVRPTDVRLQDDNYETELTKAAENAVGQGVNEVTNGPKEKSFTVKKAAAEVTKKKTKAKKRKAQRQNRKKNR